MKRTGDNPRSRGRVRGAFLASLITMTLALGALSACGGGGSSDTAAGTVVRAGRVDIKLPKGYKVVNGKVVAPASKAASTTGAAGGTAAPGAATDTTIPLDNKEDPSKTMFSALGKFRSCLDELGIQFIGAPNQADPSSPTNDPAYLDGLSTCAARSNIVAALKESQSANDNLSPAEIELRNKGYLKWRSCMIDRGWKIPKPVPDSQGRLFAFGGGGGGSGGSSGSGGSGGSGSSQTQGSGIEGPPGKDLLSSEDLAQCAAKSQKATGQAG
jgi:hypothetical protein